MQTATQVVPQRRHARCLLLACGVLLLFGWWAPTAAVAEPPQAPEALVAQLQEVIWEKDITAYEALLTPDFESTITGPGGGMTSAGFEYAGGRVTFHRDVPIDEREQDGGQGGDAPSVYITRGQDVQLMRRFFLGVASYRPELLAEGILPGDGDARVQLTLRGNALDGQGGGSPSHFAAELRLVETDAGWQIAEWLGPFGWHGFRAMWAGVSYGEDRVLKKTDMRIRMKERNW